MFGFGEALQVLRATQPRLSRTLLRSRLPALLWASLLAVHIVPLWKAWLGACRPNPGELQVIAPLWLSLAVIFFILKLLDLRCLRFRTDRRSLLIVSLAVLLMHSSSLGIPTDPLAIPGEMPLLTSVLLLLGLESVQELFAAISAAARRAAGQGQSTRHRVRECSARLPRQSAAVALVPRAPPIPR